MRSKMLLLATALSIGVFGWYWRVQQTALVTLKAFRDDATIEMVEVTGRSGVDELWKSVLPGEQRLAKAPWKFRLSYEGKSHAGLVVIDGDGPIVLK